MNISWEDAQVYVNWLSDQTGKSYRLLSESEWEYAARAGTATPFANGEILSPSQANYDGSVDGSGPSDVNRQSTMPVGSFAANGFGLYDMQGNVSEWVDDCWHDDYTAKTPTDGSAWIDEGNCNGRVVRGGSWEDSQVELRSAARTGGSKEDRFYSDGLRIARRLLSKLSLVSTVTADNVIRSQMSPLGFGVERPRHSERAGACQSHKLTNSR
jgi:formylglycine-generating enzyme required for sulfatase activity